MHIPDSTHKETLTAIAKAADLCLRPCKHSIIDNSKLTSTNHVDEGIVDLILRVESRDERGDNEKR